MIELSSVYFVLFIKLRTLKIQFQHGHPPILRKPRQLDKKLRENILLTLPPISNETPRKQSIKKEEKKSTFEKMDIVSLVENKVKNLKHNAFLYLTYSLPTTSGDFTPYSLM